MIQSNINITTSSSSSFRSVVLLVLLPNIFIHLLSFGIYLHPLTSAPTPSLPPTAISRGKGNDGGSGSGGGIGQLRQEWPLIYMPQPQLDELHIMNLDNHDISPPQSSSSWTNAWNNDYWGRPLSSPSSHKSWRPITVWSFRFLKGGTIGQRILATIGKLFGRIMNPIFGFDDGVRNSNERTSKVEVDGEEGIQQPHNQPQYASELFVHRFINVMIHAAIVQLVGTVALLLFHGGGGGDDYEEQTCCCTKYISTLLFVLHPTHVEAVVNAANRPHILALLFNATIVDPTSVPIMAMAILAICGLLASETGIFHYPAIVFTMTAIRYRELHNNYMTMKKEVEKENRTSTPMPNQQSTSSSSTRSILTETITSLLPRYILLILISSTYLIYRYCNNTLSIPDGLIRPAENPFYDKAYNNRHPHSWTWTWHFINYSYIVSLHIMKSFGVEIVGSSHEYGYDCIPEMESLRDGRLVLPMILSLLLGGFVVWSWHGGLWSEATTSSGDDGREEYKKKTKKMHDEERIKRVLYCLVFLSWMATLFPISGILKVGTFVADRIVVASTFGTCIFVGRFFALGIVGGGRNNNGGNYRTWKTAIAYVILLCLGMCHLARRTHQRASEWMDSVPLLESSLKACPRSIKSNLEMSKLYSGLVQHMLDLERAL